MLHFYECPTVGANCNTETQIGMGDGTVEHFPGECDGEEGECEEGEEGRREE